MKSLILLRHAKSDWNDSSQKDFDRPLNPRGLKVAPRMGAKLVEQKVKPDLVLSSPAERAKHTVNLVVEQFGSYATESIVYKEEIYEASVRSLLEVVNNIEDSYKQVMIVGHNPSFSYLAEYLTGEDIGNIPTCGAVRMKFDVKSWKEISQGLGELKWYIYPKQFDF